MHVSGEGGSGWQYAFGGEKNVQLLHHGDSIHIRNVTLGVRHTPGHTPEHLTFVIVDEPATSRPLGAFTGDFIFVGDVGRPDLLERAAGQSGTMDAAARTLHASLRQVVELLPDYLLIWPGHGAGSACGKSLGGVPVSSLGYEKLTNWAFAISSEEEFVRTVLEDQPEPPRYFAEMKRVNRVGLAAWKQTELREIPEAEFANLLRERAVVIDIRETDAFSKGYVRGSIGIPFVRNFLTWAGSLLAYGEPVYLIANDTQYAADAARALSLIGLDDVAGWFPTEKLSRVAPLSAIEQLAPEQVAGYIANGATVVDVRGAAEYRSGHIDSALNIPLVRLEENLSTLPRDRGLLVYCQAGTRSAIAVSVLQRAGFRNAVNLNGGFAAYAAQEKPVKV